VVQRVAVRCRVLQQYSSDRILAFRTVLQWGAVCCSVLQCVAVCCNVVQDVAMRRRVFQ